MKIGYPCINRSIGCTANSTFRLKSYSETLLIEKVTNNLNCLEKILKFNIDHGLFFFRISSDLVPFASHHVCEFDWLEHFSIRLKELGKLIKKHKIRISMHPDQFVLINAPRKEIVEKSILDLTWHCQLLDAMKLGTDAKIQIHVGGVYNDKINAIKNFIYNYKLLPNFIKKRLVIENDDRLFSLADCKSIHNEVGLPIIFDNLHHACLHNGETILQALEQAASTWKKRDGILMTDYSSQQKDARLGKHAESIDVRHFKKYIELTHEFDFDVMLEIKDKEKSALKAIDIAKKVRLF